MICKFTDFIFNTSLSDDSLGDQVKILSHDKCYLDRESVYEQIRQEINHLFIHGYLTSNMYNNMLGRLFDRMLLDIHEWDEIPEEDRLPF